jgi:small subunit ribosomal protein S8
MTHDPISDLMARLKNAARMGREIVDVPFSRFKKAFLDVLVREGYIEGYEVEEVRKAVSTLKVKLKYHNGEPVIEEMKRVSKLGCRRYSTVDELPLVRSGLGILILSTSQGVISDREAYAKKVGGEILCSVY